MDYSERLRQSGIVPVVVIDDSNYAVDTANALLEGGIDVMEITMRTSAALDAIRLVSEKCPGMLVGAGTVLTLDQAKSAVEAGAKFIVSPGINEYVVKWCLDNGIAVFPGCVTPTEITTALNLGINVLKFFPANIYGGLSAMKSLSAPFGSVKFIPTGGINAQNLSEYISAPFIFAVGGSWICAKSDIAAGNFEKIKNLAKEAVDTVLGFEVAHIGINAGDSSEADSVCKELNHLFGFSIKEGKSSCFSTDSIEVMKFSGLGKNGHIAIRTNNIHRARAFLEKKGYLFDADSAKYKNDSMSAIYLRDEIGGFAIHLVQK